ncbi:Predicted PurR-regulated permease PerM [Eubacterium ruminantium]|nr:Predicted PurR-regulated permease PerM [Eubacterium ruminantium]
MKEYWKDEAVRKRIFTGAVLIILYLILSNLSDMADVFSNAVSIFSPFILGAAIAFILNVPISKLEKHLFKKEKYQNEKWHGRRRALSMVIVITLAIVIVVLIILLIVPELSRTIVSLAKQIPEGIENISTWLIKVTRKYPEVSNKIAEYTKNWEKTLEPALDYLQSKGASIISNSFGIITGIVTSVTSFLISFIFSLYIISSKERLSRQGRQIIYSLLSVEKADKLLGTLRLANRTFSNFISGQCLDAFMLGCEFIIVLSIAGMPYVLLIGIMIMLLALIPILGAFIGLGIGFILILLVSPIKAVIFAILFTILQQVDANLVYPHIVGSSVGLPGMWVLMSVTVGGSLFGLPGMLVLIPISSVIYALFREHVAKKLNEKAVPSDKYMLAPPAEEQESVLSKEIKIGRKNKEKKK